MTGVLKTASNKPTFSVGKIEEIVYYEIFEHELDTIAEWPSEWLFFNIWISLFSLASGFLIALLDSTKENEKTFIVYTIIVIVWYLIGIILLLVWLKNRKKANWIIDKIKSRKKVKI